MSACVDFEIRPESNLTPLQRAKARDCYVREFERAFQDWTSIAKACIDVERDQDYKLLGFPSWHAWILDAAPKSRSYIYLVVGRFKELIADIPEEELAQIPLGSAGVLQKLPRSSRANSKIRQSAKQKPEKFVADLQVLEPLQAIEARIRKEVFFTASQWTVVDACFQAFLVTDEHATFGDFVEWLCSEQAT